MAAPEELPIGERQYEEPHPRDLRWAKGKEIPKRWRMHSIFSGVIHIEPVQDGVHRYPPVQIDVPRRPDFIARYINMPPTDWRELFKDETPADKGPVKLPAEML
jgi:hypothetical protein